MPAVHRVEDKMAKRQTEIDAVYKVVEVVCNTSKVSTGQRGLVTQSPKLIIPLTARVLMSERTASRALTFP
jgi:hypothetical protein